MTPELERARVFLALPLGEELGERVARRTEPCLSRAEWRAARPAGLHATLVFLGALERERAARLAEPLARALAGLAQPALRLAGTGAFPDPRRPRVLWAGIEERAAPGRLAACHRAVLAGLAQAGIDPGAEAERPFRPHVTVARPRHPRARVPEEFLQLALGLDWDPPAVVLFESLPGEGGQRYVPLGTWPFGTDG